ncbi:uncharacterized protein METZ01_LOCUS435473, partial [marine metagenome]
MRKKQIASGWCIKIASPATNSLTQEWAKAVLAWPTRSSK